MISLKSGKNDEGKTEYYVIGLDTYESFEQIIPEVLKLGPSLVDQIDGIYSRTALFDLSERKFKIIFHEDVGIYAFAVSGEEDGAWLLKILNTVVENLNS